MLILNSRNASCGCACVRGRRHRRLRGVRFRPRGGKARRHDGQARLLAGVRRTRHRPMCALPRASIISRKFLGPGVPGPRQWRQRRARRGHGRRQSDRPSHLSESLTGVSDLHSSSIGVRAGTENGDVEIMEQVAFRDQFGVAPEISGDGMAINGLRFEVADLAQGRSTAPAKRRCFATPCRPAGGAAGFRPWRNPDIRGGIGNTRNRVDPSAAARHGRAEKRKMP